MEKKHFQDYNCDLGELQKTIEKYFVGKCYRVTNFHKGSIYLTQAAKDQPANIAIFSKIVGNSTSFDIELGCGKRINSIEKLITLQSVPLQTKLLLGEPGLEKNFWDYVSTQVDLKRNTYCTSKKPSQISQVAREREIIREIEVVYCTYCGFKNNARLSKCTECGGILH